MQRLAILGFGNQAKAWALNLRDSGWEILIILRAASASVSRAKELGFPVVELAADSVESTRSALAPFTSFAFLIPDHEQLAFWTHYHHHLPPATPITPRALIFAHGFTPTAARSELMVVDPAWSYLLLAPKAIASELRFQFQTKGGLGAVYSLELASEELKPFWLHQLTVLASALGITAGPYPTTLANETNADLFSEQTLLCAILPYLAEYCFNSLVEQNIEEEVAYFECWYEVKLIVDTLIKIGPRRFFELISPNALVGSQKGRALLIDDHFRSQLARLWREIEDRTFDQEAQLDPAQLRKLRSEIDTYWRGSRLQRLHEQLEPKLFFNN